jgi:hypothetical protein
VELLEKMVMLRRSMEGPMDNNAGTNCSYWGQFLYGARNEEAHYLKHLDGSERYENNNQGILRGIT